MDALLLALATCAWVYPQNPAVSSPACTEFAYPNAAAIRAFKIEDRAFGLTVVDAISENERPPVDVMNSSPVVDRKFQHWALRNVAHHLWRAHYYMYQRLNRTTPSKPLNVHLTKETASQGSLKSSLIVVGGPSALMSEVIIHEYAHHLIEWERPGITAGRGTAKDNPVGYAIVEAYANHLAFVLDDEPRFGEYNQARNRGNPLYVYSVETECSMKRCDQPVVKAGVNFQAVIMFGALLWDLKKHLGGDASVVLMLDSIRLLDVTRPLTYSGAIEALVRADQVRTGGVYQEWILDRARVRWGNDDFDSINVFNGSSSNGGLRI